MKRICPKCGDFKFGSYQLPDGTMQRMCHGYMPDGRPCKHTWHQSDDATNGVDSVRGVGEAQVRR